MAVAGQNASDKLNLATLPEAARQKQGSLRLPYCCLAEAGLRSGATASTQAASSEGTALGRVRFESICRKAAAVEPPLAGRRRPAGRVRQGASTQVSAIAVR